MSRLISSLISLSFLPSLLSLVLHPMSCSFHSSCSRSYLSSIVSDRSNLTFPLSQFTSRSLALREDHLLDMLESPVEDKENWIVRVWYDGDEIARLEVLRILWTDIQLASGSMAFVLLYLLIHTQSVFLSIAALITIIMSVPLSYVVFAFLSGTQSMSIASFLSLFLVVGLGADVVFVYTDFWRLGSWGGKMKVHCCERLRQIVTGPSSSR